MQWLVLGLSYVAGGIIFYQDIRYRAVTWIVFPALLLTGISFNLVNGQEPRSLFSNAAINAGFLAVQFSLLWLYFYLRKKTGTLFNKIGSGDILFLAVCCFFFSPLNFFLFYILSLIFSLSIFLVFYSPITRQRKLASVPMAGLQSLFLQLFITINFLLQNDLASDAWLLDRILFYDK